MLSISSFFKIKQGKRCITTKENHFTDTMLSFLSFILSKYYEGTARFGATLCHEDRFVIGIGLNTTTKTLPTMVLLVTPQSYRATSRSFLSRVQEAAGQWVTKMSHTWSAGTFGASFTIGEVGVFFNSNPGAGHTDPPVGTGLLLYPLMWMDGTKMSARASVADGDFAAFTVDPSLPLVVEYWIRLKFV